MMYVYDMHAKLDMTMQQYGSITTTRNNDDLTGLSRTFGQFFLVIIHLPALPLNYDCCVYIISICSQFLINDVALPKTGVLLLLLSFLIVIMELLNSVLLVKSEINKTNTTLLNICIKYKIFGSQNSAYGSLQISKYDSLAHCSTENVLHN